MAARRLRISFAGLFGTAVVHSLLVLPLALDLSTRVHRTPNRSGAGASTLVSSSEPAITVVFVNEPAPPEHNTRIDIKELASRGIEPLDLRVVVLSRDPWPAADADANLQEQQATATPQAVGDQTQHALLYGRYLGQVQARIERAWMRPRTEIGAPQFSCRARVLQDRAGDVVGIQLDHCNGTQRWQQSLVSAIRTASPLPAPPDPSVYADRLWLTFHSEGFRPNGSTEGFEPQDRRALAMADQSQERELLEHLSERFGGKLQSPNKKSAEVIHLTIIGSPNATVPAVGAVIPPSSETLQIPSSPQ